MIAISRIAVRALEDENGGINGLLLIGGRKINWRVVGVYFV